MDVLGDALFTVIARRLDQEPIRVAFDAHVDRAAETWMGQHVVTVKMGRAQRQCAMSIDSKARSLSDRVRTHEERARRQDEIRRRTERIMTLKAQGLNYATIGIRMGLSPSTISRIAREFDRQADE